MEVWQWPHEMMTKMLGWIWAVTDEKARMRKEQRGQTLKGETVSLDYSAWFNDEGF
jgi:hypothetical protein